MRLHSLIFAANAGIACMALSYDPKVSNFMKSLDLSEYAMPLSALTAETLLGVLRRAWGQREEIQKTLREQAEVLKESSSKLPEMALNLLERTSELPFSTETVQSLALQRTRSLARKEAEVQTLTSQLDTKTQQAHLLQIQVDAQQREMELRQAQFEEHLHALQTEFDTRRHEFEEHMHALQTELDARRHELNEILSSKTWRLAQAFRQIRFWLVPLGSRREKMLYRLSKAVALVRYSIQRHGLLKAIWNGFRILGIRAYHWSKRVFERNKYNRELKQLDALIAQHTGFFDLFHVPMGWKTILFQRFQHVSLQTAKLGGLALYGGHPIVDRGITVYQKAADHLYVFDATNRQVVERLFQALGKKKGQPRILRIQSIDLVTTEEDVTRFIEDGFTVVYEYIDEINPAITGNVPDSVYRRHLAILKDERVVVVATSDQLVEEVQEFRSKNFVLSTNGVDLDHWRIPKGKPPSDLGPALNGNLIVGYHGALAKWMDYDLLRIIADAGPYEVVLIGHEHDGAFAESGLKHHPRVHFLGSKTYFELNTYTVHYDIAMLPFKKTNLTQAVSPVKIFEYMAARKPVVTTDLRECKKYQSCLIASTHIEFLEQLKNAAGLRNDLNYLRLLDKEASENSWERKTIEILRLAGVKI
jgi:glycosyltransferase involved in cell wall biosynthesis